MPELDALGRMEGLASGVRPGDIPRVAREFEALLVGELMKQAATPIVETPLNDSSASRMYRDWFFREVAQRAGGGFGLARQLEAELQGRQGRSEKAESQEISPR